MASRLGSARISRIFWAFQRLNGVADIQMRIEHRTDSANRSREKLVVVPVPGVAYDGRGELARSCGKRNAMRRAKEVDAQIELFRPVHIRKPDLQKNLSAASGGDRP